MAKRKNPLKDLDSFLKQEAASLVTPEKLTTPAVPPKSDVVEKEATVKAMDAEDVIAYLTNLYHQDPDYFRRTLHQIIQQSLEKTGHKSAHDKMLINTILYLDHPNNWKATIKQYWQKM